MPIFNAAPQLARCLDSLLTCGLPARVVLADDASTDPQIASLCADFSARCAAGQVRVLRQTRNLGFVGNVNAAMRALPEHDALLLNSDTVVTPGWLQQMLATAQLDPRIATVTPWSNNAEICSFPEFCRAAALPEAEQASRLARAAATLADAAPVDLPTAVGFAMWIRRAAWDQLGGFDEDTFGKGYGEENDFCLRAAGHGWRNVLCPSAYVAHEGNVSFAALGLKAGGENLARLLARYPHYNSLVARFIEADPIAALRTRLQAALESA